MRYYKGQRVKLSPLGYSQLGRRRNYVADREGVIATEPREGATCFAVKWDGNATPEYYAQEFLEAI